LRICRRQGFTVHGVISSIRGIKTIVTDETETFGSTRFRISCDLIKKIFKKERRGRIEPW